VYGSKSCIGHQPVWLKRPAKVPRFERETGFVRRVAVQFLNQNFFCVVITAAVPQLPRVLKLPVSMKCDEYNHISLVSISLLQVDHLLKGL
jgi:hypothetical protein